MTRDRSKDRPKTAAELMAELRKDPDFLARERAREQQDRENRERYARAAGPLLAELDAAGFRLGTLGELRQLGRAAAAAVPILLRWLPRADYPPLKEEIVRTLSVPWAGPLAAPALIAEFERAGTDEPAGSGLRWAIANALSVVAGDPVFEEIVRLARDAGAGKAREMLTLALGNMTNPRARASVDQAITSRICLAASPRWTTAACPPLTRSSLSCASRTRARSSRS